jgi:hypothetical protein
MSKMNTNAKPFTPKGTTTPKPPKAPPLPGPSSIQKANTKLNTDEGGGRHSRSRHVGMSDTNLKNRNINTATSFKTAHDQNKAAAKGLDTPQANTAKQQAINSGKNKAITISGVSGRTNSIARVAKGGQTFNAKVTETTMVMQKNTGKVLTTYPSKFVPLPKPASGPNIKPTSVNKSVTSIATGKENLRSVPKPVDKGPDLGNQKRFKGVTKNAK